MGDMFECPKKNVSASRPPQAHSSAQKDACSPNFAQEQKKIPKIFCVGDVTIELAATAGFCFGVARAVRMTERLLDAGKRVATLGPLIHNPQVVDALKARGADIATSVGDVPKGATAVIRSHGVPRNIYDEALKNSIELCDATCPFVAKIHDIAKMCEKEGALFLVAGDAQHPEVQGIVGHTSGEVIVFSCAEDLRQKMANYPPNTAAFMVAQTTFQTKNWLECVDFIKKEYTNLKIFDTICNATWSKQREAQELAQRSDLVIVVGGRGSSNTKKLLGVVKAHTRAYQVESAQELCKKMLTGARYIGVTAGASTPSFAIEEVLATMNDVIREEEMSFEQMLDESMKPVYAGQIVKGVVEAVSSNEVTVDIGIKQTGIVRLDELTDDPAVRSADEVVKRDEELELVVVKVSDQDGIVYLSKRQMEARKGAQEVSKAAEDGTIMQGYVTESNKGGLVANVKGVKVFIPASQATMRRGEDYTALVRTHVRVKIKEFSPRRTIGSIREVLADEQKAARETFWGDVEIGKKYVGTVKSLTSYGAFVDIGGVDGLVHISELSWSRIKHPSEVVNVGDKVEVYVKDIDTEKQKVSLGFKQKEDDPWEKLRTQYPIGSTFTAPVVSLTQFGAFVRILPDIDGLVHISEISHERVEKVQDALSVGQEVEVKLLDVDFERRRVSLSIKALLDAPEAPQQSDEETVVASASAEETTISPELETEE